MQTGWRWITIKIQNLAWWDGTSLCRVSILRLFHRPDSESSQSFGKEEDAIRYAQRAAEVREAILKEYFTPSGRCAIDTQTAYVVALYMELTPASMRPRLIAELHRKLEENNMKLTTGFVGTAYLCRVLSEYGGLGGRLCAASQ